MFTNPTRYGIFDSQGVFLSGVSYGWEGRSLVRYVDNSTSPSLDVGYVYNESGLRIRKTVNGVEHSYTYDGDRLVYESYPNNTLRYIYDERGLLASLVYTSGGTSTRYHYVRDVTLNIFGLIDDSGNLVVRYTYDAWGNILSTTGSLASTLGVINPFRYKGYYYDSETGMYYCQTRYYVPQWCRWLSADSPKYLDVDSPERINLFAYCMNNPLRYVDRTGHFPIMLALIILGAIAGAVSYTGSAIVTYLLTRKWKWSWSQFAGSVIGGAIGGALTGLGFGPFAVGFGTGFFSTYIGMNLQNYFEGTDYSVGGIFTASIVNGFISGLLSKGAEYIRIKGLTAGSNSYKAISQAIVTRYVNGGIGNMALTTIEKIGIYNLYSSMCGTIWSGFADASGLNQKMANFYDSLQ